MAADLRADVAQLKLLHSQARRPHVQVFLSTQIQSLEKLVTELEARAASAKSSTTPEIVYTNLSNLTWEQDTERVKVLLVALIDLLTNFAKSIWNQSVPFSGSSCVQSGEGPILQIIQISVSLEGVEEDKVESQFQEWAFEVKIHDVEGKNYRCHIQKLHKEVDPDACRVLIKPKRIIISLRKLEEEDWKDLHFKEDKSEEESKREPMDRLLEMMRNMYDDGDDEMKKTISDAWTTYRSTYKPGFKKPMTAKRR